MKKSPIELALFELQNPSKAKFLSRFFKTGVGQYAEGDKFLGITNPQVRQVLRIHGKEASIEDIENLVRSPWHEARLLGFLCVLQKYEKTKDPSEKEKWVDFYLSHKEFLNNWDLIDITVPRLLGNWLIGKNTVLLYSLAKSNNMWENRIAMLATFAFIRIGNFKDCLAIAEILLLHPHDLIHKAVGWMLREMGKKDKKTLLSFLEKHSTQMPRTMLRYSIEKLPEKDRKSWLLKK